LKAENILSMQSITKRYGENTVLEDVNLSVRPGEIHALLGENGAGKSTLMNVLFGMPVIHSTGGFDGQVFLDGEKVNIASPHDAMEKGIGMVHQEFMLLPEFTIAENIKLNREITNPNLFSRTMSKRLETLDMPKIARDARKALNDVGMGIDEYTRVAGLPIGYMQFIEIAREIDKTGVKLLVFDEPTAVLTESEADKLISVMKKIAANGISIIFITHRLDEVIAASDVITILRDGKTVANIETKDATVHKLAELMVGRRSESIVTADKRTINKDAPVALSVRNLYVDMPGEEVKGIDFDVYKGEIFGIGGLAGQGKIGIPNGIMGLYDAVGDVKFFGEPLKIGDPKKVLSAGISMVSEDRKGVGLMLDQSIQDNIVFNAMQIKNEYLRKILFFTQKKNSDIEKQANTMIKELDIRCFGPQQPVGTLSGGNQQKVCIAKALTMKPKFLFVSEPTRGIDIGAKRLVLKTLVRLSREEGITIVMVSSELQELRSISDRIAIVSEGKIVDILSPDASNTAFGLAMSGIKPDEKTEKEAEA
jgi:simple sugar transport system ATP-binding protein